MAEKQTKFIFVTGGVVSGLGKGITAASLGRLLKCRGLKVASQKLDPYVNVDPGTMSPLQHGEVFVTDDGTETDLDLGHYERFIDENLNKYSNLTTGKVYWNVLNKERQGAYLGQTVQIIPHITNEIKSYIYNLASSTEADVVITEIGGTTGDIESQPFLEAIRQVGLEQGRDNCCYIHVVLVPYISGSDEYKSKPAQHSVKELQGMGVNPDIIIVRADGSVCGMRCVEMELGEPDASGRRRPVEIPGSEYDMDVDTVIMSLGTSPNPLISSTTKGLEVNKRRCIIAEEETGKTSKDGVYAGGDAVTGAATVILAMGAGKAGAKGIDEYLKNK